MSNKTEVNGNKSTLEFLPRVRCNNCLRYFHETEICPDCKSSEYLMDVPEIEIAVNSFDDLLDTVKKIRADVEEFGNPIPLSLIGIDWKKLDKVIAKAESGL